MTFTAIDTMVVMTPVRCYGCNMVFTGRLYNDVLRVQSLIRRGERLNFNTEMNKLGLVRECCRNYIFSEEVLPCYDFIEGREIVDEILPRNIESITNGVQTMAIAPIRGESRQETLAKVKPQLVKTIYLSESARKEAERREAEKKAEEFVIEKIQDPVKIDELRAARDSFEQRTAIDNELRELDIKMRNPNFEAMEAEVKLFLDTTTITNPTQKARLITDIRNKYDDSAFRKTPEFLALSKRRADLIQKRRDYMLRDFWTYMKTGLYMINDADYSKLSAEDLLCLQFEARFRSMIETRLASPELFGHTRRYVKNELSKVKYPWREVNKVVRSPVPVTIVQLNDRLVTIPRPAEE